MVTKRVSRKAVIRTRVTDRAVALFCQMRALPVCTCIWGPNYFNRIECSSCLRWWTLQNQLHTELGLFVGDYPAISHGEIGVPPYAELEGGRIVHRSMPYIAAPGDYDGAQAVFAELMRRAGE